MKCFKAFLWMGLATLGATMAAVPQTPGSVTIVRLPEALFYHVFGFFRKKLTFHGRLLIQMLAVL